MERTTGWRKRLCVATCVVGEVAHELHAFGKFAGRWRGVQHDAIALVHHVDPLVRATYPTGAGVVVECAPCDRVVNIEQEIRG